MNSFEKVLTVKHEDLDELKHVNNVQYVQWIQDISKKHWQSYVSKEIQNEVVWVVMNHNINYKGAALLNDSIKIQTHITESKGARCFRVVEMYNTKTNQLLLHSITEWCLLNAKTLRPTRISNEIKAIFS